MSDKDKILANDLIKISVVSELLTGDRFALRLDRSFGKHEGSVNRLFEVVQDWIDSDKLHISEYPIRTMEIASEPPTKFATENIKKFVVKSESETYTVPETVQEVPNPIIDKKTDYEYLDKLPFSNMISIIGQKAYKDITKEIYYIKPPWEKGLRVIVLHSEKEVKDFIRKEIVK